VHPMLIYSLVIFALIVIVGVGFVLKKKRN